VKEGKKAVPEKGKKNYTPGLSPNTAISRKIRNVGKVNCQKKWFNLKPEASAKAGTENVVDLWKNNPGRKVQHRCT